VKVEQRNILKINRMNSTKQGESIEQRRNVNKRDSQTITDQNNKR